MSAVDEVVLEDSKPDLEVIVPEEVTVIVRFVEFGKDGVTVTVEDLIECRVKRLKTVEFLALMRVLTRGLGPNLASVNLDLSDPAAAGKDMAALLMLAIPEAVEQFVEFITKVVVPVDPKKQPRVTLALGNPDLDLLPDVIEAIVDQEKDDLVALAGKVQGTWGRLQGLFQKEANAKS